MATLSLTPSQFRVSHSGTLDLLGTGTAWLSSNPSFTLAGVAGCSVGTLDLLTDTTATIGLTTGNATGVLTVRDSTTNATATLTIIRRSSAARWCCRRR